MYYFLKDPSFNFCLFLQLTLMLINLSKFIHFVKVKLPKRKKKKEQLAKRQKAQDSLVQITLSFVPPTFQTQTTRIHKENKNKNKTTKLAPPKKKKKIPHNFHNSSIFLTPHTHMIFVTLSIYIIMITLR